MTPDVCYLCREESQIQSLGSSFLVDCPRSGTYEIEAVMTTIEAKSSDVIIAYLAQERESGKVRPLLFRELFRK